MRVAIHDFVGHPFTYELAVTLARRGTDVGYLYCASLDNGMAAFEHGEGLPAVIPVSAPGPIPRTNAAKRFRQEYRYGRRLRSAVESFAPEVLVSANAPSHVQVQVQGVARARPWANVLWIQDLYGIAIRSIYGRRSPVVGAAASAPFVTADRRLAATADHVVVISEDFIGPAGLASDPGRVTVIENWAPVRDIVPQPKSNRWSTSRDLASTFNFVYSGTLGMKHDPGLLLALADAFDGRANVVVVGSGVGVEWLRARSQDLPRPNLHLVDPVAFEDLPDVLATGDVLVVLLESDAGVFSVPSKTLSYLCAGRPVLGAMPRDNLANAIVRGNEAGLTSPPDEAAAFLANAERLFSNRALREQLADNGLGYARATFDIESITDRWMEILERVAAQR